VERLSRGQYEVDVEAYPPGGLDVFVRMQRDAQVRACLTTKRLSVLSEQVEVHPAGTSPLAVKAADVVREQLAALPGGPAAVLTGALDALALGFAIGELLWNPDGTLGSVFYHDPRRFAFHGDAYGDVEEVEVLDAGLRWPRDRFVLFTYQGKYGSPYGESDLVAAYRAWSEKDLIRRMWLTALDRFGTPTPIARVPTNWTQAECDHLAAQLRGIHAESALVVPNDVELGAILDAHRVEPGAGFHTAVLYQDAQIARSILGQEMTSAGNSGAGGGASFSLAQVHLEVQNDWIQALRADLAETVLTNQVARPIVAMTLGPDAPCPKVRFPNLSDAEMAARRSVIAAMIAGKVVAPTEAWIRSFLGLPEDESHA
jgi:phage gp29-like protein